MNKKIEEGFNQFDKAFKLVAEGIEDFFKNSPVNTKTVNVSQPDVIVITISSFRYRIKAAWRILTRGKVSLRKKM